MVDSPVSRARALIGTRFRLHGRAQEGAASGVDCVGLVAHAYSLDILHLGASGYPLRSNDRERLERAIALLGFAATDTPSAGDLIVMRPGPVQLHLGVWTGDALIHADALLRRVVETPGTPRWPVLSRWTR